MTTKKYVDINFNEFDNTEIQNLTDFQVTINANIEDQISDDSV